SAIALARQMRASKDLSVAVPPAKRTSSFWYCHSRWNLLMRLTGKTSFRTQKGLDGEDRGRPDHNTYCGDLRRAEGGRSCMANATATIAVSKRPSINIGRPSCVVRNSGTTVMAARVSTERAISDAPTPSTRGENVSALAGLGSTRSHCTSEV